MSSSKRAASDPAVVDLPGRVVCTDGGQHQRTRVTVFADRRAPEPGEDSGAAWGMTPEWDVIADTRPDALTLRFFCRRCRRDTRLKETKVLAAISALREATGNDHVILDISALPC